MSDYPIFDETAADANFFGQVLISIGDIPDRRNFIRHTVGGISLLVHIQLPIVEIVDAEDLLLGYLIGHVIEEKADPPTKIRIEKSKDPSGVGISYETLERELYKLGGKFIFVASLDGKRRLYLDTNGCLPILYSSEARCAASSAGLLLSKEEYTHRFRTELYNRLAVHSDGWFPSGLTAHDNLSRLLCNHYLDLDSWTTERHWPKRAITPSAEPAESVRRISEIVGNSVEALRRSGSVGIALTGGNETRFVLSCLNDTDGLKFYTVAARGAERDVYLAGALAKRFNLDHHILPFVEATEEEEEAYRFAASHCVGGANPKTYPSTQPMREVTYFLGGLGGEVGRAFFWRSTDTPEMQLNASDICGRFGLPKSDEVLEATNTWLNGVTKFDALTKLDLAYIELRMCAWGFAAEYSNNYSIQLHPLVFREVYENMLSLPPDWKRENKMILHGIASSRPELLEIPINKRGILRDSLALFQRAAMNPQLIVRKIRKTFSGRLR